MTAKKESACCLGAGIVLIAFSFFSSRSIFSAKGCGVFLYPISWAAYLGFLLSVAGASGLVQGRHGAQPEAKKPAQPPVDIRSLTREERREMSKHLSTSILARRQALIEIYGADEFGEPKEPLNSYRGLGGAMRYRQIHPKRCRFEWRLYENTEEQKE